MNTDARENNGEMVKLNVKVPKRLLEELDELAPLMSSSGRRNTVNSESTVRSGGPGATTNDRPD